MALTEPQQYVGELCLAGDVTRHLRSSSSEILASGNRRVPVKVARWNVRTMLRAGKLENIKHQTGEEKTENKYSGKKHDEVAIRRAGIKCGVWDAGCGESHQD